MPYLFLHGLGQDASSWNKMRPHVTDLGDIICPELSSFYGDGDITYGSFYHNFSKYCEQFSDPLQLCGLSLGAVLALHYALDHPARVKSLVLIAPQYQMPKALLKFQNIVFQFLPKAAFKSMGMGKQNVIHFTKSMVDLDFSGRLHEITCPVLILCGEKDNANKKAASQIAEAIAGARLRFIKRAGHEVNTQEPEALAEVLCKPF